MICVFSAICEEDNIWIPQYLREIERLGFSFVIYFDRCSEETKNQLKNHPYCVGYYEQDEPEEFHEARKQKIFEKIPKAYKWALAWDVDEVWELAALEKFNSLPEADYINCLWVNLWGDDNHIRVDGNLAPKPRTKLYNLALTWNFTSPIINGPYSTSKTLLESKTIDLACIHHGLKTKELRELHKQRWDRIYTKAIGKNPYGAWAFAVDETIIPIIEDNPYETNR